MAVSDEPHVPAFVRRQEHEHHENRERRRRNVFGGQSHLATSFDRSFAAAGTVRIRVRTDPAAGYC
jgi:hypothetical protein